MHKKETNFIYKYIYIYIYIYNEEKVYIILIKRKFYA